MTLLGGTVDDLIPQMRQEELTLEPKSKDVKIGNIVFFLTVIVFLIRGSQSISSRFFFFLVILGFIGILLLRKNKIQGKYIISDKGLIVPSTWITQKMIPWDEIVEAYIEEVKDQNGEILHALRIILDTDWIKVNTTGMEDSALLLTENEYEFEELKKFHEKIIFFKNQFGKASDTLNERLRKQVFRSWENRNKRAVILWLDVVSESVIYFSLFYLLIYGILGQYPPLSTYLGIFLFFALGLFIFYWSAIRPYSIVGIRPNELGAVNYVPDDVVTNIRFVVVTKPYALYLMEAEFIYDENNDRPLQVADFVQIHPEIVKPGELAHGIAQITGNHVKAKGAVIKFKLEGNDTMYSVPIYW